MPILTRLRQWFQRQRCPEPNPMFDNPWPLDPARMARLERRIADLEQRLADPPSPPALAVDMDAHLGAN